jgi:hypothetical protein
MHRLNQHYIEDLDVYICYHCQYAEVQNQAEAQAEGELFSSKQLAGLDIQLVKQSPCHWKPYFLLWC